MKKVIFLFAILFITSCNYKEIYTYDDLLTRDSFGFSLIDNQLDKNIRSQMEDSTIQTFSFSKIHKGRYSLSIYGKLDGVYDVMPEDNGKQILLSAYDKFEFNFDECKQLDFVRHTIFENDSMGIRPIELIYNL